ncbi:MAG: CHAT domain-containing protein [Desulfobacterota bacterium]|nr:CHAT domain-containing protein [Thermodesulfobacteriota bacterium]
MEQERDQNPYSTASEEETSIEKLLRERERLDAELKNKFSQHVTVMFTDIKGSTTFFETYGDIEGRLMVQKHNEMLFPIIAEQGGRVVKTIGDAIMAAFESPLDAVRAAIRMQQRLNEYNQTARDKKAQIHIRIGINTGEGLVEKNDIYGDVVNVAARVESLAEPDQILVSAAIYEEVRTTDDIVCRYLRQTKVKGKEEPIEVYRVVWSDEDTLVGITRSTAAAQAAPAPRRDHRRCLEIDITRDQDLLRITAAEKSARGGTTIRPYEELRITFSDIDVLCQEVTSLLNRANTRGKVSKEILAKLRDVGQVLFDTLLSAKAKEALRSAAVEDLIVYIEDTLVQIPWELLYDGEQFLCQKYNMGRIVKTRGSVAAIRQRVLARPLKMLIVADPRGDLPNAGAEGRRIREQLDQNPSFISANQRTGSVSAAYLMEKIRNFDIVHYAGHADYDTEEPSRSGWMLAGGKFTSADIVKLIGGRPMPALVFCNACQSGQTQAWKLGSGYNQKIFGLANAFLLAGVQHYVGTFWEILDEPGADFAVAFYSAIAAGAAVGEAVRKARHALIRQYGEDTIVWASYMLYGDPSVSYYEAAEEPSNDNVGEAQQPLPETARLRSGTEETVSFSQPARRRYKAVALAAALVILAALVLVVQRTGKQPPGADPYHQAYALLHSGKSDEAQALFASLPQDTPHRSEGLAAVAWARGDTTTALALCSQTPQTPYAHVIKGSILFSQGALDDALREFTVATEPRSPISWQHAQACNGIGRIYSVRGDMQKAAEYYAQAAAEHPDSAEILANQAYAMQQTGNTAGALDLLQKATRSQPGDTIAAVMLADIQRRQQQQEDNARQQRIDELVRELAASFKTGAVKRPERDPWTSQPLTVSFLTLVAKGAPAEREGEDEYFLLRTSSLLQDAGAVQVVERELLDKLLAELKLGSTALVDPATALQLGKIINARVILSGTIMRSGGQTQVMMRLVDTETTLLKGAVTVSGRDIDALARDAVQKIKECLTAGYPLRGIIARIEGDKVVLNIGADVGVTDGMRFGVVGQAGTAAPQVLTVAAVSRAEAFATVAGDAAGLKPGMKVEQMGGGGH